MAEPLKLARRCGDCQLCCQLVPVVELDKPANTRCAHQRFGKGCAIYARRPPGCQLWTCAWLSDPSTRDMQRPDRVGYVVDVLPDFVTLEHDETKEQTDYEALQIWCDPQRPNAHHDPALRAWIEQRCEEHPCVGLVRFNNRDAILIIPPAMNNLGVWADIESPCRSGAEHSVQQIAQTLDRLRRQQ